MTFRNFELSGEEAISPLATEAPFRCARLISALESFVSVGVEMGTLVDGREGSAAVYLTPPRSLLRAVPDAAALVLVDPQSRTLELIHVAQEYGADDAAAWPSLVALAQQALS